MTSRTLEIQGRTVPRFLYGTAWKEAETKRLVALALQQGFRGIDTANQRKHYHEAAVGEAIAEAIAAGLITRDDLFLQTKFTFQAGQDHRLPYDPAASVVAQVAQSFESSLKHLGLEKIDSYVLHGPSKRVGLAAPDWEAWRAMEALHADGRAGLLGISNVSAAQLKLLCEKAKVRPSFVQNRCFAVQGWDRDIRKFCRANEIVYQGFSLLTANREALAHPELLHLAQRHGRTVAQIVFRFALDVDMVPLTGTTNAAHMQADLDALNFRLSPEEIERIESIAE
ncbi:MAG: aldo/keto reductase [Planctomycetia bacterium]|nr:aldo/keto reductase [Planctomycetia bacterium]